jgi:large subunit ribosomal protein L10
MEKAKTEKVGRMFRKKLIDNIKEGFENNTSVFLLSYSAVSATQMDSLRKDLKRFDTQVYVSKNRIAKIALKELSFEKLAEDIDGQTAFAWSNEDSAEISKVLMKFSKDAKAVSVYSGLLDGAMLNKDDIKRLSDLPSKNVLQAQVLQMMLSPLTRLVTILNSKTHDLLSILKQLSEKKEGGN